jgi:hypothetical protein
MKQMPDAEYSSRRLVTRECPCLDDITALAQGNGWPISSDDSDNRKHEVKWDVGPQVTLHYVEDKVILMCYIFVTSTLPNLANGYADAIERELGTLTVDQISDMVEMEQDPVRQGSEIIRLGVAAPPDYDDDVFERISTALGARDERLREMAIWATSYSAYPQYRPLLRRIANEDPVQRLRERAEMMLEAFDRAGVAE